MLKYVFLLINSISILFYNLFFGDGVSITPKLPTSAKPNSEFVAEIVINKGSTSGFAKLQIELPKGLSAKELDSKGGTFTYTNGFVKYIWASLPSEEEFTVKVTLVADASCTGTKQIQGKFSYIASNVKQQNDFGPIDISFDDAASTPVASNSSTTESTTTEPPPTTTNTTTTTNTETPPTTPPTTETTTPDNKAPESFQPNKDPNAPVSVRRRITANSANEFTVDVVIFKETLKGFAKFMDKIPAGFTASEISSDIASFSFNEQFVKYVWVSLPTTDELKLSYKLTMTEKPTSKALIIGEFSYLENDQTKAITAPEDEIIIPDASTAPVETTTTPTETTALTATTETTTTPSVTPTETNTITTTETTQPTTTTAEPLANNERTTSTASINFNVQVGAFKKNISTTKIASMYKLTDNIRTDMHDGLTKFLIGNFDNYKKARDKRETIKNKGVTGAFVTAYNSGKRITIQEALMITSQKWLR